MHIVVLFILHVVGFYFLNKVHFRIIKIVKNNIKLARTIYHIVFFKVFGMLEETSDELVHYNLLMAVAPHIFTSSNIHILLCWQYLLSV